MNTFQSKKKDKYKAQRQQGTEAQSNTAERLMLNANTNTRQRGWEYECADLLMC